MSIEAWTLSFDSNFTIDNLWNGRVLENNGTSYTVAAEMWTNPVQPNSYMTIGFVGSKAADVEALLSNFRLTEVVIGEGMPVIPIDPPVEEIEITANAVYDEENDNITVSWNTNNSNGTFDILMSEDGENFVSIGTVEGVSEFIYTPENEFETLYFKVVQTVGEQVAESNVVAVSSDSETIVITSKAFYDEENDSTIILEWTSNYPNGIFEVMMSDDGEDFISLSKEENISKYSYTYEDDFNVLYFKVKQTVGIKNAESNTAKIVFYIDWEDLTDTDGDGLSDVYEKYYYETDPLNPDTDGDSLPDGYEVLTLGTDPTKADTDDNGISDADEDFDEDGLSNFEEYQLETDPLNKDTDNDGLSDYDEINSYNTDPLEYDTDGDIVSDGDEIALGLNPLSPATNGIPDNERTFEQTIESDNLILYFVNTAVNPFEVSVEINAAGVAENNLEAEISGYNYTMKNEAILGVAPAFSYADGLKVENVVINFDLDSSITENTNGKYVDISKEFAGIKRFNVFRYFEDTNMLLPIETFHDVGNNRVYANTDELGTYCLVDMEIWLDSLGVASETQQASIMPLDLSDTDSIKVKNGDNLDVVFIVYSNAGFHKYLKAELATVVTDIFNEAEKRNVNARIHFVTWTGGMYTNTNTGTNYAENIDDAVLMINNTPVIDVSLEPTIYMLTKAVNGIKNNMTEDFLEDSDKYCFVIDSGCNPACSTINGGIDTLKDQGMDFSFVYAPGCKNINNYAALSSNNSIYQMVAGNGRLAFSEFVYNHIFDDPIKIISSAGLVELPEDFGEISVDSEQDYDNDGLLDVQEIYFDVTDKDGNLLVTINNDGSVELPSFSKCVSVGGTYVEQGLKRFYDEADESILSQLDEIKVLPILADPTSEDGDGDGVLDLTEFEIMQKVKNSAVALTEDGNENAETTSADNMINTVKTNTIVDFSKNNSLIKKYVPSETKTQPDEPYTLARDNDIKIFKNSRYNGAVKYSILGKDTDAYYLEFCSKISNEKVENYLRINVNMKFSDNLNLDSDGKLKSVSLTSSENSTSKAGDEINRNDLINAIKNKWGKTYKGTDYDFYKGMNVDVSVRINIVDNNSNSQTKHIRTIDNDKKKKTDYEGAYATIILDTVNENNPYTNMGLTSDKYPTVFIYTNRKEDKKSDAKAQNRNQIESVLAHEFGHVLGLMDAYGHKNEENYFVEPVSFAEIQYNKGEDIYGTEAAGEMMHRNGVVTANDIEMVIYAKKTGSFQFFVPIGKTNNNNCKLSPAIRANYIYYVYLPPVGKENTGLGLSKGYYYFDKISNSYKALDDTTKVSSFTNLDDINDLNTKEYQMYESYLEKYRPVTVLTQ